MVVTIGRAQVTVQNDKKILGCIFDRKLSWRKQEEVESCKLLQINKHLRMLSGTKWCPLQAQ